MKTDTGLRGTTVLWALAMAVVLIVVVIQPAQAQTFNLIYSFNNPGANGIFPTAGLTLDGAGDLYGTTYAAGSHGYGAVYKVTKGSGGSYITLPLYEFEGGNDGSLPAARVVFGPEGDLYGTTTEGGGNGCHGLGCGTVFKLTPPPTACKSALCPWTETVLYRFTGGADGVLPEYGDLIFDSAGAIYGTTSGGDINYGSVYKLTNSGGTWTETTLWTFTGGIDGEFPLGGVIFDHAGNLYGTTDIGVFELSPSNGGWTETVIHTFDGMNEGLSTQAGVVFDSAGNLYGDTDIEGPGGEGTIFQMTPSGGSWNLNIIQDGGGLVGTNLNFDAAGNLYGVRISGRNDYGEAFKMSFMDGSWTYTLLHAFTGGDQGASPYDGMVMDANGILYGTSYGGGAYNFGMVYSLTP